MKTHHLIGALLLFAATALFAAEAKDMGNWVTTDQPGVVGNPLTDLVPVTTAMVLLGAALKHWTPVDNRWIPALTLVLGMILYMGYTGDWSFKGAVIGLVTGGSATGLHATFTQGTSAAKDKSILEPKAPDGTNLPQNKP